MAIQHFLEGIEREDLEKKIDSFFCDKSFVDKILKNPTELLFFVQGAYNLFVNNPQEFKNFYSERFRKEAKRLNEITDKEKYGVLIVKARQLYYNQQSEDFLAEGFKELKPIKYPGKEKRSKSPSFGKYYNDETNN